MFLNEMVKSFLKQPETNSEQGSSIVPRQNVLVDLTHSDIYPNTGSFFDSDSMNSLYQDSGISDIIYKQKEKIMTYRQIALGSDVSDAIDEIVNEIIFVYNDKIPVKISINEDNKKLVDAITEKFEKIIKLLDLRRNLFSIVKRSYIDGQINIHCMYDKSNTKKGIQSLKMLEPVYLYFDARSKTYKYMSEDQNTLHYFDKNTGVEYNIEELIREDFGLYDGNVNLGYLEYAIKPANMLRTLEDLLIPMRFSRSISRRVFNVDVGDLPNKRASEIMTEYQMKFKYKKFYNIATGEVSNQQHITSMVEDYWFANRSGGRGTEVSTLDETGNLGEINDILYFNKKLYKALKIPFSRIDINPDGDKDFDWDSTRITKDDMKFFMFIQRIRQVYSSLFKEILKREVISTGIMSEQEWDDKEGYIEISFGNENKFIQKMKLDIFSKQLEIYSTTQEYQGKLFPVRTILKDVMNYSDEEIEENFKEIQKEEKDPIFSKFYQKEEE
jgi:antitoxin component of RelBE/YafQ-DinJ toxin-antitoxin module